MAALLLLNSYRSCILKYLKNASNHNIIRSRKANFHFTAKYFQEKCPNDKGYTTRLALPPDYENVTDFMLESYYKYEPVFINMGMQGSEPSEIWRTILYRQVKGGLSIIAENRENCIIGAALNCITIKNDAEHIYDLARCCACGRDRDVIQFFGYVAETPKIFERYCVDVIFQQASLAVSHDFQGQGVARRLIQESWLLARDCGYRLFRWNCNNSYCARIAMGFGWTMAWCIPFSQYICNGQVVFKHIQEPHTVCQVFVDYLRYCKTYCLPYKHCKTLTSPPV
ncbi:Arylalkylamine N-acetyltransferase 1 [Anthophora retusa]